MRNGVTPMTYRRRTLFAVVPLAAALASGALSCGHESSPAGLSAGDGEVHGSVTVAKTGVGVPNLIIALLHDGSVVATAATDGSGLFSFPKLVDGTYTARMLGLELTPFRPSFTAMEPESTTVHLTGQPVDLVFGLVGLVPPRVAGLVTCNGTPVDGARVRIVGGTTDVTVTTNAQGKYGATDLGTGFHAVILDSAPCTVGSILQVIELRPGQAGEVNFGG
jgi:hypothetical protein